MPPTNALTITVVDRINNEQSNGKSWKQTNHNLAQTFTTFPSAGLALQCILENVIEYNLQSSQNQWEQNTAFIEAELQSLLDTKLLELRAYKYKINSKIQWKLNNLQKGYVTNRSIKKIWKFFDMTTS